MRSATRQHGCQQKMDIVCCQLVRSTGRVFVSVHIEKRQSVTNKARAHTKNKLALLWLLRLGFSASRHCLQVSHLSKLYLTSQHLTQSNHVLPQYVIQTKEWELRDNAAGIGIPATL